MSRVLVANDQRTVHAEIHETDDGVVTATCEAGDWATELGRIDPFVDVVQEAQVHMDQVHS